MLLIALVKADHPQPRLFRLSGMAKRDPETCHSLIPLGGVSIGVQTGPLIGAQKGPPVRMAER